MDTSSIITGLVVLMVLGVVMISVVIPTTQAGIAVSQYAGTVSNEEFTGVAATPSTLTKYVAEVISFKKGTITSAENLTALVGANSTRVLTLTEPSTTLNRTFVITSNMETNGDNITYTVNGVYIGKLSSNAESWTGAGATLLNGANTFAFTNHNGTYASSTNITNITTRYTSYAAYPNYTVSAGAITPLTNGSYKTNYYYASTGTNNAVALLNVIPLLLAIMLVLIVIGFWKYAS